MNVFPVRMSDARRPRGARRSNKRRSRNNADSTVRGRRQLGTVIGMDDVPGMDLNQSSLFPTRRTAQLRYAANVQVFTGTSGTVGGYVFRANDMYDPDYTATGNQPLGFDQAMYFYERFTVRRARIKVIFQNRATAFPVFAALSVRSYYGYDANALIQMEQGNIRFLNLYPSGQNGSIGSLETSVDVAKFFGVSNLQEAPDYSGSAGGSPTSVVYFQLLVWQTGDTTALTVNASVVIDYDVEFTEPKATSRSLRTDDRTTVRTQPQESKCGSCLRSHKGCC